MADMLLALAGLLIIAVAVFAVIRQVEVRLALAVAGLALGLLAGEPMQIVQTFLATLAKEQFVIPICTAMGFAYVLKLTECDQHLVHLLIKPMQRVRMLLIPGGVLVGFLVNIPVISQTSTAVAIGSVLVPLMRAARLSPATIGSALLLGSSLGGELLNPGAPELNTIADALKSDSTLCVAHVFPLLMVQLAVATGIFWLLSLRAEAQYERTAHGRDEPHSSLETAPPFRVNLVKAAIPLVPLVLLFLTGPPLKVFDIPKKWLIDLHSPTAKTDFPPRLIGAAMLIGVVAAALTNWRTLGRTAKSFFEGAGYALTHIISLIVVANCFGEGVKLIGLARLIGLAIEALPTLLLPTAGTLPLVFAWVCGSGMAATQSLYSFFVGPARDLGMDPMNVGAVVSIGAAAGRTSSPVAAVTLMSASLTETDPLTLAKRVAVPLLAGMVVVVTAAMIMR
jgi:DcuC family C4-dicarboxylate transporter